MTGLQRTECTTAFDASFRVMRTDPQLSENASKDPKRNLNSTTSEVEIHHFRTDYISTMELLGQRKELYSCLHM